MRLDTNYYYWPPSWVVSTPGFFTGSGMPMRFAQTNGTIIDVYQAATQMTDESGQAFPETIDALLDNALGSAGYYGAFTANMHADSNGGNSQLWADQITSSAKVRAVPVISAKQMLTWLDGRNGSCFGSVLWSGNTLAFSITAAEGANGLQAMLPTISAAGALSHLTQGSVPVSYALQTVKGVQYAFFSAASGIYESYLWRPLPPVVTELTATPGSTTATITWTTDKAANSRVDYGLSPTTLTSVASNASSVSSHRVSLIGLTIGTLYYFRVTSVDVLGTTTTSPPTAGSPASFTTIDPNPPVISAVTAIPALGATARITWNTDELSNSRVDYGTSPDSTNANVTDTSMVTAHSIVLTGLVQGTTYYYRVTSVDSSGNTLSSPAAPATAQFVEASGVSVWNPSVAPRTLDSFDGTPVEVGMKFRSDVAGSITGVRFYKAPANTGTHIGHLWTSAGTLLGDATFTDETTSGWQQASFSKPIPIAANITYVVSYFAPNGRYSADTGGLSSAGVDNAPLHALREGVDGPNGVHLYGSISGFPSSTFNSTNYWVDVVFADTSAPRISGVSVSTTATTATITWATDKASSTTIDYGTASTSLTSHANAAALVTSHGITLTGLIAGTTYFYRVTSFDGSGNGATSPAPVAPPSSFIPILDTTPPVISAVTATPVLGAAATITWTTNKLSNSRLQYARRQLR